MTATATDAERWDERHREAIAAGRGDRPPADWLATHHRLIDAQPRGAALDVACGRGRNALYLAQLGFDVEAIDVSAVAIEHLRRRAAERGLAVRARLGDLTDGLPGGRYEVVVNTFFLDRTLFGAMREALAPGGLLVFDTFAGDGTGELRFGLHRGELLRAFAGLEIVSYREGPPEPGARRRAALVARAFHHPGGDLDSEAR